MLNKIIIADTSCLIALNNIGELEILFRVYGKVTITRAVSEEFGEQLPTWIEIEEVKDKVKVELLLLELDKGESSAIVLGTSEK